MREKLLLPHGISINFTHDGSVGSVSDGYHTFNELYLHRHFLFLLHIKENWSKSWKSLYHADGSSFEGWFIAGTYIGEMLITYHLPMDLWEFCHAKELDKGIYDGHSSLDVIVRMRDFIKDYL